MKKQKDSAIFPNKHLHSRISFLYQAATYLNKACDNGLNVHCRESLFLESPDLDVEKQDLLDSREDTDTTQKKSTIILTEQLDGFLQAHPVKPSLSGKAGSSRRLLSHLRGISLKSQIRLTPNMKHSVCKRCDSLLLAGNTSNSLIENKSRGGKKPWADVLVVTCNLCGMEKRFPTGAARQLGKAERVKTPEESRTPGNSYK